MSITVYSGVMGSGKSYEAVKTAILGALKKGRRVITNISGFDQSACFSLLTTAGFQPDMIGPVVVVSNERVAEPNFFPGEKVRPFKFDVPEWVPLRELHYYSQNYTLNQGKAFSRTYFQLMLPALKVLRASGMDIGSCLVEAATREWKTFEASYFQDRPVGSVFAEIPDAGPSVVQPGDLVVIDEAWRYWADSGRPSHEHMNFFRMHRHYVDENGVSCDLVVLIQDFGSLNRFLRGVCELTLVFYKLKALGLMNRYRVESYEGRPSRKTLISTTPWQKYEKKYFPLYKSYDGNGGKEAQIDTRQSIFANKLFLIVMACAAIGLIGAGWWFVRYVVRLQSGGDSSKHVAAANQPGQTASKSGSELVSSSSPSSASDVRLVGLIEHSTGETTVIFQLSDGRTVRQRMNAGQIDGWQSVAGYQGRMASFFMGAKGK